MSRPDLSTISNDCLNDDWLPCIALTNKGQYCYIYLSIDFLSYHFVVHVLNVATNIIFFLSLCKEHWMLQEFWRFLLTDSGMRLSSMPCFIWSVYLIKATKQAKIKITDQKNISNFHCAFFKSIYTIVHVLDFMLYCKYNQIWVF